MAINNQIIGGNFTDPSGAPLANGYLIFQLCQDEQSSTPGQIGASRKIQVNLDSTGNVPASPAVFMFANDSLNPANSYYTVWAYTSVGQPVWGPQQQQVLSSPSPFNLSNWVPNSINTSSVPAPTTLFETNGVVNGSQTKFNAVAGSGMTITDDGSGNVTFASSGNGSSSSSGAAASPSTLNVTTEGTKDWLVLTGPYSSTMPTFDDAQWHWKKLGSVLRRGFRMVFPQPIAANTVTSPCAISSSTTDDASFNQPLATAGSANWGGLSGFASVLVLNANNTSVSNINWGFTIEAPAGLVARTLTLYIAASGGFGSAGHIQITGRISDGSASDVVVNIIPGTNTLQWYKVPLTFKAASEGQRFDVSALVITSGDAGTSLGFQAATLA